MKFLNFSKDQGTFYLRRNANHMPGLLKMMYVFLHSRSKLFPASRGSLFLQTRNSQEFFLNTSTVSALSRNVSHRASLS